MDNENAEEIRAEAGTAAEAAQGKEVKEQSGVNFGKFKSADALLKAYLELEAEFTRRSKRLKELENGNKAAADVRAAPSRGSGEELAEAVLSDADAKRAVIEDYLKSLSAGAVPLITGGVAPAAPRSVPKSVKEAGALAQRFFKNE